MRLARVRHIAAFLALAPILVACSSDKTTGPAVDSAVGVYVLQTINGSPLPFNAGSQGGVTVEIVTDTYSINADGTYSEQGSVRLTQVGSVTTQQVAETGVWQRSGTALNLHPIASSTGVLTDYSGSLAGSTLTITISGFVGLYKKP